MSERDEGFTLIEVLVVAVILGLVATAIAAAFTIITRVNPSNSVRNDDSRTALGLNNYLPLDVSSTPVNVDPNRDSDPSDAIDNIVVPATFTSLNLPLTPPSGFSLDPSCDLGTAVDSVSLLGLYWTEGTVSFGVNYRLVDSAGWVLRRYACEGGVSSFNNVSSVLLSSSSDPTAVVPPPVSVSKVTLVDPPIVVGGVEQLESVSFTIHTESGQVLRADASSDNPAEAPLPTLPTGTTPPATSDVNDPPVLNQDPQLETLWPGETRQFAFDVSDPNGDDLVFNSIAEDPAWPSGWAFTVTGQTVLVTAPGTAPFGENVSLTFVADDQRGETVAGRVTFTAVDPSTDPSAVAGTTTTTTLVPPLPPVPVPCVADIVNVDPSNVKRVDKFSVSQLVEDVVVQITWSGDCEDLVLVFDVDDTDGASDLEELSFSDGTEVRILAEDFKWSKAQHDLCVRNGAGGLDLDCERLNVT